MSAGEVGWHWVQRKHKASLVMVRSWNEIPALLQREATGYNSRDAPQPGEAGPRCCFPLAPELHTSRSWGLSNADQTASPPLRQHIRGSGSLEAPSPQLLTPTACEAMGL